MRFIILLILISIDCYSQVKFCGKIISAGNGVPFVTVGIESTTFSTLSDSSGNFCFTNLSEGEYKLVIHHIGFKSWQKSIDVKKDFYLDIALEENIKELKTVTIQSQGRSVAISNSAMKTEVINPVQLKRVPVNNLMESLPMINGVQEQNNCGVCNTNEIKIHGMKGPYTLILIDGMPVVNSLGAVYGLNGIPVSIIEELEVIKGPSSAEYGADAMAGVLNIITKHADEAPKFSLESFITTHLEKNLDLSYSANFKRSSLLASSNIYNMQNWMDHNKDNFSDVALSSKFSGFLKYNLISKDSSQTEAAFKYYYEDRSGSESGWDKTTMRGSSLKYGETIYTNRYEFLLHHATKLPLPLKLDFSAVKHEQNSYYGNIPFMADQMNIYGKLKSDFKYLFHHFTYGADLKTSFYRDNTDIKSTLNNNYIPGIFLQDEMVLSERIIMNAGLRSEFNAQHGLVLSPRIHIKYKPFIFNTFRFGAGRGYRVVNVFTEDHAALSSSRVIIINKNLAPENSYNFNLNYTRAFSLGSMSATFDMDIFYSYFTNKIVPDYLTDPVAIFYNNLDGESVSRGLSAGITASFSHPLNIYVGATYQNVFSRANGNITSELFSPAYTSVGSVLYTFKKLNFMVEYSGNLTGPMELPVYPKPFNRAGQSEIYSIHNIQVTKIIKRLELFAGCKNIFSYVQESPLIDATNPFGPNFDTSYAYGPLQGRRYFLGIRFIIDK